MLQEVSAEIPKNAPKMGTTVVDADATKSPMGTMLTEVEADASPKQTVTFVMETVDHLCTFGGIFCCGPVKIRKSGGTVLVPEILQLMNGRLFKYTFKVVIFPSKCSLWARVWPVWPEKFASLFEIGWQIEILP